MKYYYAGDNEIIERLPVVPLHLVSVGKNTPTPIDCSVIREDGRQDFHLLYVVNGRCMAVFEGKAQELSRGDCILYPPRFRQEYSFLTQGECESYYLHFCGTDAQKILDDCSVCPGISHVGVGDDLESLFSRLIIEHSLPSKDKTVAENGILLSLFSLLGRRKTGTDRQTFDKRLEPVLIAMSKTDAPLSLPPYAEMLGVSVNRLIHLFRACMGRSPLQYLTERKIEHAKRYLSDSTFNVAETAAALGYDDPMYFSRLFRKKTGISPSQYQNRIR